MTARRWVWVAFGVALGVAMAMWTIRRRRSDEEAIEIPVRFDPVAPPIAA